MPALVASPRFPFLPRFPDPWKRLGQRDGGCGQNAYSVEKPTAVEGTGKPWENQCSAQAQGNHGKTDGRCRREQGNHGGLPLRSLPWPYPYHALGAGPCACPGRLQEPSWSSTMKKNHPFMLVYRTWSCYNKQSVFVQDREKKANTCLFAKDTIPALESDLRT